MDLIMLEGILIVLIGLIALSVISYFLTKALIKRYRRKALSGRLTRVMKALNVQPFKTDHFSDKILVLDIKNALVIYLDYLKPESATVIQLEHLKDCKLVVRGLIVRLDLIFNTDDRFSIVFYRRFVDPKYLRSSLTARAKRWHDLFIWSMESLKQSDPDSTQIPTERREALRPAQTNDLLAMILRSELDNSTILEVPPFGQYDDKARHIDVFRRATQIIAGG